MEWVRPAGRFETLLDALTAVCAAFAGGVMMFALLPPGMAGDLGSALAGAATGGIALLGMRCLGTWAGEAGMDFEPCEWPDADSDELLLDDALEAAGEDSRVVRLFAPETIAAPGELAERIDRWLGDARERVASRPQAASSGSGHHAGASAASAAFHSALADLRRSLR